MTEFRDVLFELGTEELPPKSLLTLSRSLCQLVEDGLAKAGIRHGAVEPYASPRRLALILRDVAVSQPDQDIERRIAQTRLPVPNRRVERHQPVRRADVDAPPARGAASPVDMRWVPTFDASDVRGLEPPADRRAGSAQ